MKNLFSSFILLSLIIYSASLNAQCKPDDYSELFEIEVYESKEMTNKTMIKKVAIVDPKKCYAKAINELPDYFSYLMANFSKQENYAELDLDQEKEKLRIAFYEAVSADNKLGATLDEHFYKSNGSIKRDQIVFEELVDVATKFFTVKDINEDGQYLVKVCTGINLLESTLPKRKPYLEAFAFAAILDDIKGQEPNLMNEFQKEMKSLYDLNLGNNKDEQLLRAQGAALILMKQNTRLNSILATYYTKYANLMPFEIINKPQ